MDHPTSHFGNFLDFQGGKNVSIRRTQTLEVNKFIYFYFLVGGIFRFRIMYYQFVGKSNISIVIVSIMILSSATKTKGGSNRACLGEHICVAGV